MSTKKIQIIGRMIATDSSLTEQGVAADAEAVGNKFISMTTKFDDYYLKSEADTLHTEVLQYVDDEVAALVNAAPETLDTLGELAAAFEENQDMVETLNDAITYKADKIDQESIQEDVSSLQAQVLVDSFIMQDAITGDLYKLQIQNGQLVSFAVEE